MKKLSSLILFFFFTCCAYAAIPSWQIVPQESKLTFMGTGNNVPIQGEFKKFSGDILFDPAHLDESRVRIIVDINSISMSFNDFAQMLLSDDWFQVKMFPQAVFEAKKFNKTGENSFDAYGLLTIRDKSLPVTVTFHAKILGKDLVQVTGDATLKRLSFGIGRGEWGGTDDVKDDVTVHFDIKAKKK